MNFCPKCGTAVALGARFCPNCGFDLHAAAGQTSTVNQTASQPVASAASTAWSTPGGATVDYQSNLGFIGATKQYFQNYVNLSGRMSRANYWWAYLAATLIGVAWLLLDAAFGSKIFSTIGGLVMFMPNITGMVRRLHDSNHSTWSVCWLLVPIVGWIYFLVLLLRAGYQEANRFG